jgi:hypothetical protein
MPKVRPKPVKPALQGAAFTASFAAAIADPVGKAVRTLRGVLSNAGLSPERSAALQRAIATIEALADSGRVLGDLQAPPNRVTRAMKAVDAAHSAVRGHKGTKSDAMMSLIDAVAETATAIRNEKARPAQYRPFDDPFSVLAGVLRGMPLSDFNRKWPEHAESLDPASWERAVRAWVEGEEGKRGRHAAKWPRVCDLLESAGLGRRNPRHVATQWKHRNAKAGGGT